MYTLLKQRTNGVFVIQTVLIHEKGVYRSKVPQLSHRSP